MNSSSRYIAPSADDDAEYATRKLPRETFWECYRRIHGGNHPSYKAWQELILECNRMLDEGPKDETNT